MILHAEANNLKELTQDGLCVVDFYSETCGPCKLLAPILSRLDAQMPFVTFVKVNLTQYPDYGTEYEVDAVPTLLFVKDGQLREREVGFLNEDQLKEIIGKYLYE